VSTLLKVRNDSLALALDIAATARLKIHDDDKERHLIEALTAGTTASALHGLTAGLNTPPNVKVKVDNLPRQ
jgi:hypothetical protein